MDSYLIRGINKDELFKLANTLAPILCAGDIIVLEGELGVGKTTFVQAMVASLGGTDIVKSPTYTIVRQYRAKFMIYHFDFYRLFDGNEDLGWSEYFYDEGICLIEWGKNCARQIPAERLEINFHYVDESTRDLYLYPVGERYEKMCAHFFDEVNGNNDISD